MCTVRHSLTFRGVFEDPFPSRLCIRRRYSLKQKKIDIKAYLFLLPAFVIFSSVVIVPTLYSFYLSFFSWNGIGEKKFVAFKNYVNLFTLDPVFITALKNNFIWILLTVLFTVTMSLLLAVVLNRSFKGRVVTGPFSMCPICSHGLW